MAERDAQPLQIGLGHVGQDFKIDGILGKDGRVLGEPDPIKPSRYLVVDAHCRILTSITCSSKIFFSIIIFCPLSSDTLMQIKIFSRLLLLANAPQCSRQFHPNHRQMLLHRLQTEASAPRSPTTGIVGCCACAASGHAAAAPPSSVMNSRRFMSSMGDFLPYALSAPPDPCARFSARPTCRRAA